jgi:hypothetical protein
MSSSSINLPKDIDLAHLSYGTIKSNDNGGKSIFIGYKKQPLVLQIPDMSAPFGVNKWPNVASSIGGGGAGGGGGPNPAVPEKYSLDLSFKGAEDRPAIKALLDVVTALDDKLVEDAMLNSQAWFKKKYPSKEVVQALYTPIVKHSKDRDTGEITNKYPPTMKLALPCKEGRFTFEAFDAATKQHVDVLAVDLKGASVGAIVQCTGIWIAGGKFGCSWKVVQMRVKTPQAIRGYSFQVTEEDREPDIEDDDEHPVPAKKTNSFLDNSDED